MQDSFRDPRPGIAHDEAMLEMDMLANAVEMTSADNT